MILVSAGQEVRGPVRSAERALAPDLTRGVMLLLIGIANAAGVALGGPGVAAQPEGVDRALNLLLDTFVHARAYPVFAIMFGYGLVQLAERQAAAGATPAAVRSLLRRRHLWLVAFGFGHAALLYFGDFLAAYGLIGIAATVLLLDRGDRVQRIVLWLWAFMALEALALGGLGAWQLSHPAGPTASLALDEVPSLVAPTYLASVRARLSEWPAHTATVLGAIVIVWLGMWAARHQLLDRPSEHRRLLVRVALIGLGLAFLGGLPLGLTSAGFMAADERAQSTLSLLHQVSGMFGGPGYIALLALAASSILPRPSSALASRAARLVAALGQRSLSGYLFQSIAWLVLLTPYGIAAERRSMSPLLTGVAVAAAVWIVSVCAAGWLERSGRRGPAEALLRHLVYRKATA